MTTTSVTPDGSATAIEAVAGTANGGIARFQNAGSVTPGTSYIFSADVEVFSATGVAGLQIAWRDASGAVISGSDIFSANVAAGAGYQRLELTGIAPAGASGARINVNWREASIRTDNFCFRETPVGTATCANNIITWNAGVEQSQTIGGNNFITFGGTTTADLSVTSDAATGNWAMEVDNSGGGTSVIGYLKREPSDFTIGNIVTVSVAIKSTNARLFVNFQGPNQVMRVGPTITDNTSYGVSEITQTIPAGCTGILMYTEGDPSLPQATITRADDFCISDMGADASLPVTLSAFTGEATAKTNKLSWTTATEENTAMFYLERSGNGIENWEEITTVAAAGFSQTERAYTAEDANPFGQTYYRLRSVDFDGAEQLSDVITLTRANNAGSTAYPNPFGTELTLATDLVKAENYRLIDALGRTLSQGRVAAGVQRTTISTANLPAGRYLVRLGNETISVIK